MDKDRLEYVQNSWIDRGNNVLISKDDFAWLIEQAEQLEKLQDQTLYSDFINRINELEKEIKRLKEARKENSCGSQPETHTVLD